MSIKQFFVDALTSALDLGIGTPDDVVRHVTPDVLAAHLPRPLWARLLTACLGAPRVDAALIVETLGIPNLCEYVPWPIIWTCIAEMGDRSLGQAPSAVAVAHTSTTYAPVVTAMAASSSASGAAAVSARSSTTGSLPRAAVLAPPPEERPAPPPVQAAPPPPVPPGPSIPALAPGATAAAAVSAPLADLISELESDTPSGEPRMGKLRPRSPTAERFRQSNTAVGRLTGRRPQAAASSAPNHVQAAGSSATSSVRRGQTEVEDPETNVSEGADWRTRDVPVDDQLVEWKADGASSDDDFSDLGRKR